MAAWSGSFRSSAAWRLPMPVSISKRPPPSRWGALTWRTSAPCSARVLAQVGPARTRVRSRTRTPLRGRSPSGSAAGGASPILVTVTAGRPPMSPPLRVGGPLFLGADHPAADIAVDEGGLELEGVAGGHRRVYLLGAGRLVQAELGEDGGPVVEGPVELHVAAVAGGHDAGDAQPRRCPAPGGQGLERLLGLPGRAGVLVGAQARRRMSGIDDDPLAPPRAPPPQLGGGQPGEQTGRRRPGREKVGRRQDRLCPGHLEVGLRRQRQPSQLDGALHVCPIHRTPPGSMPVGY